MHKSATKCNETICKYCKNKHGASKIIDTFETYQRWPWRDPLALLWQRHFIKCLFPRPASGRHIPSLLPRIPLWGRVFGHWLAEAGRGTRHSHPWPLSLLSGPAHFRRTSRWRAFVFIARLWLFLGGITSRLLAQPALRVKLVFSS
jgi:hypothetical protein